jgi:hypothetical protein
MAEEGFLRACLPAVGGVELFFGKFLFLQLWND